MQNLNFLKTVYFCAAILFMQIASPVQARTDTNTNVLILNSYHKGFQWTDAQVASAKRSLERRFEDVEIFVEYMDAKRVYNAAYLKSLKHLYGLKYKDIDLDAIITTDDIALAFMLDHHNDLFNDAPVSFCGVNSHDATLIKDRMPRVSGVVEVLDITSTLDLALALHPETKQVAVVVDGTPTGRGQLRDIQAAARQYSNIEFRYLKGQSLSHGQLFDQLRSLSEHSIVLLAVWLRDKNQEYISPSEGGRRIAQNALVPVYGLIDMYFGHGIVGGQLLNSETHGRIAAEKAVKLLKENKTSDVRIARASTNPYMFDHEQLERWGIEREALPQKSIIINQPFSFYKEYRGLIYTVLIVFLALLTVVVLLSFNMVRRKRTEKLLSESEEKFRHLFHHHAAVKLLIEADTGKIVEANHAAAKFYGWSLAELCQMRVQDVKPLSPQDGRAEAEKAHSLERTHSELRHCLADGSVRDVEVSSSRIEINGRDCLHSPSLSIMFGHLPLNKLM